MTDSKPRIRIRGVPAQSLTSQGYSVCLFPEQPRRESVTEQDRGTDDEFIEKTVVKGVQAGTLPPKALTDYVRLHWRNRLVYIIAFVSFSLSLYNVYYFPFHVYRFGDRFFVPYTIWTIILGYPLHVLQVSMGQFSQRGIVWVWECAPLVCGIGVAMLIACIIVSVYYNIFAAYALVYFSRCFNSELPWINCTEISSDGEACEARMWTFYKNNATFPAKHYFYNHILNAPQRAQPEDLDMGSLKWWLVLALFFSWIVVYIATLRGPRSIGKISIFLVIFSYFAILMLLILVLLVSNSRKSRRIALGGTETKEHAHFLNAEMWSVAAVQVMLELGICHGIPLVYGSYCHFRNMLYIDSIILCLINYFNSVIFFIIFFSFMGPSLCDYGKLPKDLTENSIGIIYIVFSDALTFLKANHLWCMVLFLMLFCIIIGTQIAVAEAIMTVIYDNVMKLSEYRWLVNFIICLMFFSIGIVFCLGNGFYAANLLQSIPIIYSAIFLVFFFAFGLILVYGLGRYFQNMEIMLKIKGTSVKRLCLYILIPLLFVIALVCCFFMHPTLSINKANYQGQHLIIGWFLFGIILIPMLICAVIWLIYSIIQSKNIGDSTNSWKQYCKERNDERGYSTTDYSRSYTWKWNSF